MPQNVKSIFYNGHKCNLFKLLFQRLLNTFYLQSIKVKNVSQFIHD